jgi:hypothetical protein
MIRDTDHDPRARMHTLLIFGFSGVSVLPINQTLPEIF